MLLGERLFSRCNRKHIVKKPVTRFVQCFLSFRNGSRVEINPVLLMCGELRVRCYLHGRRRCSERRPSSCRKQNQMGSRSRQIRCAHKVISGTGEKIQALFGDRLCIRQNVHDLRTSSLLHTAAGLVLQRCDASLLVSGRRILIDNLSVIREVLLKGIHHVDRLAVDGFILTPGEQDVLCTEHLRNLGQNRGAAKCDQTVGETADRRICRDSGETIRPSALHADNQLAGRKLFPAKL